MNGGACKSGDIGMFCPKHSTDAERRTAVAMRWNTLYRMGCFVPGLETEVALITADQEKLNEEGIAPHGGESCGRADGVRLVAPVPSGIGCRRWRAGPMRSPVAPIQQGT